jgi:hypothetical protein
VIRDDAAGSVTSADTGTVIHFDFPPRRGMRETLDEPGPTATTSSSTRTQAAAEAATAPLVERPPLRFEIVQPTGSRLLPWLTAATAVAALAFTGFQALMTREELRQGQEVIKTNSTLTKAELDAGLQRDMTALDKSFAEHPRIDPYFTANEPPPRQRQRLLRARVRNMATLVVDFADEVATYVHAGTMPEATRLKWTLVMRSWFTDSPAIRLAWKRYAHLYPNGTACVLGAPTSVHIKRWNWKTNNPWMNWSRRKACG